MKWIDRALEWWDEWLASRIWILSGRNETVHYVIRQLTHVLGGVSVGLLAWSVGRVSPLMRVISFTTLGTLLVTWVIWHEVTDQQDGQQNSKTFIDSMAWTAGFLLILAFL